VLHVPRLRRQLGLRLSFLDSGAPENGAPELSGSRHTAYDPHRFGTDQGRARSNGHGYGGWRARPDAQLGQRILGLGAG
jgi:hypothetical protein